MNPKIFKAYDIRGIYPTELDEDGAYRIGQAFVKLLQQELPDKKLQLVVASDMRLSSPSLTKKVIEGISSMGVDVINIGLSSTPDFYFAVAKYNYDGGLIVSASHNPKEYNGMKIVRKKAVAIGLHNGLDKISKFCSDEIIESKQKGTVSKKTDVLKERVEHDIKYYDFHIKPMKVVVDVANSMGSLGLEELFKMIPCKLVKMYFELDGNFPNHQPDPFQEKNLIDLKKKVIEEKADLGIATDGDADRIFFVDEKGEAIDPSIIRGILAKVALQHNPGAKIGYDIRPGKITRDMIIENGGIPIVTKVGHTLIKEHAMNEGCPFAGESSGHFFFQTEYGFFECPLISALIIMDEISTKGAISQIVAPLKRYYHSGEINSEVKNKEQKMNELEKKFGDGGKVSWLDGVTVEHEDYWFNVRPSNTESLLRLNLEAKSKELMQQKRDEVLNIIRSYSKSL